MKFISLFAGIGGFDLALERLGHECVYANDIDKYCKIIYDKNFIRNIDVSQIGDGKKVETGKYEKGEGLHAVSSERAIHTNGQTHEYDNRSVNERQLISIYDYQQYGLDNRSITEVRTEELPDFDILCGGFPCQSFSTAGKRKGFDDIRGTMFFEIARILKAKQPRMCLLENVKGLLSHDNGRTFKTILTTLTELGYDVQWQVLNSKNFGVPQNRERVFVVGHIRGTPRPEVFPITGNYKTIAGKGGEKIWDDRNKRLRDISPTLDQPEHNSIRLIQPCIALNSSQNLENVLSNGIQIRKLTPIECERLQGFPDNWTLGVSDTQRYKMMGNAVTVNVVQVIARFLV